MRISNESASAVCSTVSEAVAGPLIQLGAALRRRGARIGVGEQLLAYRALAAVDATSRQDVYTALRCALCSGRDDLDRFGAAFVEVFGDGSELGAPTPLGDLGEIGRAAFPRAAFGDPERPPEAPDARDPSPPTPAAWSEVELLLEKDLADFTTEEARLAQALIRRLARRGPLRRSRRTAPSRRRGHIPDTRALLRDALRTGGDPVQRRWRAPTLRPRQVVLVCDVSGSMAPYARMLLQYLHACVAARRRVEAFAFGTRLTRITRELSGRDHDLALDRATAAVVDLASGTRIGSALAELNRAHGRRIGRGAVVVILSDGWDRGDPDELSAELARLRRSAHRLLWLNPLAAHPEFEPVARGMQAAVPHVDRLLAGHSLSSFDELAAILEEL